MAFGRSSSSHSSSVVRQLKWLVVVLVISNIALGVFSMYALRESDRRYSDLIDHSVPVLDDLQALTAEAAQVMVMTNLGRLESTPKADFLGMARSTIVSETTLRGKVLADTWIATDGSERNEIDAAGQAFTAVVTTILTDVEAGRLAEARKGRTTALPPVFERYISAITKAATAVEFKSQQVNDTESQRTSTISTMVLGLASWPILMVLMILLCTAIFVLMLMLLFRGREVTDMP